MMDVIASTFRIPMYSLEWWVIIGGCTSICIGTSSSFDLDLMKLGEKMLSRLL